jgi:hypothetical protein
MTNDQIERLRALCDAADRGVLREGELRELVGLAREAVAPHKPTPEQQNDPLMVSAYRAGLGVHETLEILWKAHVDLHGRFVRYVETSAAPMVIRVGK